mgnify:CR=1 FL=1
MLRVRWLGRVAYQESVDLQRHLFNSSSDDHLLLVEHEHVFTGGSNANLSNLLIEPTSVGASYQSVDRGGDITYHGPGQLTGYPILSLPGRRGGGLAETRGYVSQLEELLISVLADVGLPNCGRVNGYPGVWVEPDSASPQKIAAIGVRLSRGRTMHGFAVNVGTDLSWFDRIIPCGISDFGITSMQDQGLEVSMEKVVKAVTRRAIETWGDNGHDQANVVFRHPKTDLTAFSNTQHKQKSAIENMPVVLRNRETTERRRRRLDDAGVTEGLSITQRKPPWMKAHIDLNDGYRRLRSTLHPMNLATVCEEAGCPNIYECWGEGTATFMINGKRCTRACGFCLVDTRNPEPRDYDEPRRVAEAVTAMGLAHVVITAVARDDLDDGGSLGFIETVNAIRSRVPDIAIETLIPDFGGQLQPLKALLSEGPDVVNHNLETVARLQRAVRPNAGYARSLTVLARAKAHGSVTKSGLIVGLGESDDELTTALADLASVGADIVTIGQYLRPTSAHLPVHRWVQPETFEMWADKGREMGIRHVEAGPLTRSSHRASAAARGLLRTP